MFNTYTVPQNIYEYVDAIMREVMKKISIPTPSGYPILPKTVIEEMPHPGKPDDVETIPKHLLTQRRFDPFSVCEFDTGGKKDG